MTLMKIQPLPCRTFPRYGGRSFLFLIFSGKNTSFVVIAVAMLWFLPWQKSTAGEAPSNIAVLDSLTQVAARQLCGADFGRDSLDISLQHHAAAWLVAARITEHCPKIRLKIHAEHSALYSAGTLGITSFGVRYERLPDSNDSLRRICTVAFAGTFTRPSGELAALPATTAIRADIIAESDVTAAESGGYDFSRAAVPPPQGGFISEILEPLVIVSTAALTVLLLFSVRSQ